MPEPLILLYRDAAISIVCESPFLPRLDLSSTDNVAPAEREIFCGDRSFSPSARHRISVVRDGKTAESCLLLASGGATGIHAHSAFLHGDICFVAVGRFICALRIPTLELVWHTEVDSATCFGVYDAVVYESIISHGECEIARLGYDGRVVWSSSGRDIFTDGFTLYLHHAEAVDFEGDHYHIKLNSGKTEIKPA